MPAIKTKPNSPVLWKAFPIQLDLSAIGESADAPSTCPPLRELDKRMVLYQPEPWLRFTAQPVQTILLTPKKSTSKRPPRTKGKLSSRAPSKVCPEQQALQVTGELEGARYTSLRPLRSRPKTARRRSGLSLRLKERSELMARWMPRRSKSNRMSTETMAAMNSTVLSRACRTHRASSVIGE